MQKNHSVRHLQYFSSSLPRAINKPPSVCVCASVFVFVCAIIVFVFAIVSLTAILVWLKNLQRAVNQPRSGKLFQLFRQYIILQSSCLSFLSGNSCAVDGCNIVQIFRYIEYLHNIPLH